MFVYISYLLALSILPNWVTSQEYYWRPYINGTVPSDAYIVSTYYEEGYYEEYYIGRVPVPGVGLLVGSITGGNPNVTVCDGQMSTLDGPIHHISDYAEIFCTTHGGNFSWYDANATTLHQTPYPLVQGGYEGPLGTLYIGRHLWRNGPPPSPYYYVIGKVAGYNYNSNDVMYVDWGGANSQEVLDAYEVFVWTGEI